MTLPKKHKNNFFSQPQAPNESKAYEETPVSFDMKGVGQDVYYTCVMGDATDFIKGQKAQAQVMEGFGDSYSNIASSFKDHGIDPALVFKTKKEAIQNAQTLPVDTVVLTLKIDVDVYNNAKKSKQPVKINLDDALLENGTQVHPAAPTRRFK